MPRMSDEVQIRRGETSDHAALADIFHESVRDGATLYSDAQRIAWSPAQPEMADWSAKLGAQTVFVAEAGGKPVGFLTLMPDGEVDLAYIHPSHKSKGLFRRLYDPLEAQAREAGLKALTTHASLHAHPAFLAVGFEVTEEEHVARNGETFQRFAMRKVL